MYFRCQRFFLKYHSKWEGQNNEKNNASTIASIRLTSPPTSDVMWGQTCIFCLISIIIFYWVSVRQNEIGTTYFSQFLSGWTCHLKQKI